MRKSVSFLVVSIFLVQFLLIPSNLKGNQVYAENSTFKDVKTSDWFYSQVMTLVEDDRGIIEGYGDGSFRPDNQLTLEQFVTMVVRACGFTLEEEPEDWSKNYMDKAKELGLLDDFIYKYMDKSAQISREDMCPLIVATMEYLEGDPNLRNLAEVDQVVMDSREINNGIQEAVQKVYKLGIIVGYESDHTFRPKKVLTRAEAATVLIRIIDKSKREVFNYESLYSSIYGDFADQLKGGVNWVDPLNVTREENAMIDRSLVTSDMSISPNDIELTTPTTHMSLDYVQGILLYTEVDRDQGRYDDLERLLLRRLKEDETAFVMEYISGMHSWHDRVEYEDIAIYLDGSNYIVNFIATVGAKGTQWERLNAISFGVYYRDDDFIEKYEEDISASTLDHYVHVVHY